MAIGLHLTIISTLNMNYLILPIKGRHYYTWLKKTKNFFFFFWTAVSVQSWPWLEASEFPFWSSWLSLHPKHFLYEGSHTPGPCAPAVNWPGPGTRQLGTASMPLEPLILFQGPHETWLTLSHLPYPNCSLELRLPVPPGAESCMALPGSLLPFGAVSNRALPLGYPSIILCDLPSKES